MKTDICKTEDYIIRGPVKFKDKEFITVLNANVDTETDKLSFESYKPDGGYRFPTVKELDEFCIKHPFFEGCTPLDYGHIFINDLGLQIFVSNYIDNWSGYIYGPMVICQESIDEEIKLKGKRAFHCTVETCYDIRARKFRKYFDWRVPRHLILIHD